MKNFRNANTENLPKFVLEHFGLYVNVCYNTTEYNKDGTLKSYGKAYFWGHIYSYSENNIILLVATEHNPAGNLIPVNIEIFKNFAEVSPIPKHLTQFHAYLYRRIQQQYYDYSTKA